MEHADPVRAHLHTGNFPLQRPDQINAIRASILMRRDMHVRCSDIAAYGREGLGAKPPPAAAMFHPCDGLVAAFTCLDRLTVCMESFRPRTQF